VAHRITLLALDGCFASNLVGCVDLFNTANLAAARLDPPGAPVFEWQVLSPGGLPVRASNGITLSVDGALEGAGLGKLIVVPAFGSPEPEQFLSALAGHCHLLPWLRKQYESGVTLAASCSGSFLIAEAGLLDGRRATTSWWLGPLFEKRYPKVRLELDAMLTDCERVICSGTGMSHLDLVLHLIERHAGREMARLCAKYVVLDERRRSQAPFVILNHARSHDPLVTKAEKWIKANLRRRISTATIAAQVAVSPRTLTRHFSQSTGDSPLGFVQKIRIEASKALLENTRLRIGDIVDRVGYSDDAAFRRLFKRYTSLSPQEYRQRFGLGEHFIGVSDGRGTA
jgi:transcriptional regulator GlxA family with amidase domain